MQRQLAEQMALEKTMALVAESQAQKRRQQENQNSSYAQQMASSQYLEVH